MEHKTFWVAGPEVSSKGFNGRRGPDVVAQELSDKYDLIAAQGREVIDRPVMNVAGADRDRQVGQIYFIITNEVEQPDDQSSDIVD